MSGMAEGGLNTWGMTEGLLWVLCHALTPPHPGPLPQGGKETGAPLSCPLGPLSYPLVLHSHARWSSSVMPTGPSLSFPPVVSGNPVFFCSFICVGLQGKTMDSRLITSGMTAGD